MPFIHLNAGHDKNGNPRRAYVLLSSDGEIVCAFEEGYEGFRCVPEQVQYAQNTFSAAKIPTIPTTRSCLRQVLKAYRYEPDTRPHNTLVVPLWEPGRVNHFEVRTSDFDAAVKEAQEQHGSDGDYNWNAATLYEGENDAG